MKIGSSSALIERGKERGRRGVVAEGFAQMGEAVDISRCENETAAELKRIPAKFVLMMSGRAGPGAALEIVAASDVQQIGRAQVGDGVSLTMFVN